MTQEKIKSMLDFAFSLKTEIVVVTDNCDRVFIDFSNEDYKDTHTDKTFLYIWDNIYKNWHATPLENIKFIEYY